MHLVQAKILFPANSLKFLLVVFAGTVTHCKLGLILLLVEGLYLEISLYQLPPIEDDFPQIVHVFSICIVYYQKKEKLQAVDIIKSMFYLVYSLKGGK